MIPPEAYIKKEAAIYFQGAIAALSLSTNACHLIAKIYCENEIFELALLQLLLYSLHGFISLCGRVGEEDNALQQYIGNGYQNVSNIYSTFLMEGFQVTYILLHIFQFELELIQLMICIAQVLKKYVYDTCKYLPILDREKDLRQGPNYSVIFLKCP